jgi:NAD(P)-dependent dehydrogenase (short-subunit alcohol dehydrogenase family)
LPLPSIWSYEGKRVVVVGGGGAGMGAAAVTGLADLGAEIHVIDLREPPVDVASYQNVDLSTPEAGAAAIGKIGGPINALFNCAGVPGPPRFADVDTMVMNFIVPRHVAELCVPHMPAGSAIASIASTAGAGYLQNIAQWLPLVTTNGFSEAKSWCEAHPDEIKWGYSPAKEALIVWTMWAALELATKGIRVNCISPGPTDTPMMSDFVAAGGDLVDLFAQGLGRRSTPAEQGYPLIFLNSDAASYVSGENLVTDGGTLGALTTGNLTIEIDVDAVFADDAAG